MAGSSFLPSAFQALAEQLSHLQARLVEEHQREVGVLRQQLEFGQQPTAPDEASTPSVVPQAPKGDPPAFPKEKSSGQDLVSLGMPQIAIAVAPSPRDASPDTSDSDSASDTKSLKSKKSCPARLSEPAVQVEDRRCPAKGSKPSVRISFEPDEEDGGQSAAGMLNESQGMHVTDSEPFSLQDTSCIGRFSGADPDALIAQASSLDSHGLASSSQTFDSSKSVPAKRGPSSDSPKRAMSHGTGLDKKSKKDRKSSNWGSCVKAVSTLTKKRHTELNEKMEQDDEFIDGFKIRGLWDLSEQDLLRMKSKATRRVGGIKSTQMPSRGQSLFLDQFDSDWFMIHPHSQTRLAWDLSALFSLLYDLITVPMTVFGLPETAPFLVITWATVIFWTVDIGLSCITGQFVEGQLVMQCKQTSRRYMRTWFPLDVLVTAPEWLTLTLESASSASQSFSLLRFLRGARFIRLIRFLRLLRLMKLSKVIQDLDSRIRDDAILLFMSISKLMVCVLLLGHLMACTWYAVGNEERGWVYVEQIENNSLGDRYLYSFQWSLARLHPSNMSENMELRLFSERLLAITTTIIAMLVLSVFISSMTNTMAEIKRHRKQKGRRIAVTRAYCRQHKISHHLVSRVKKYLESYAVKNAASFSGGHYEEELATMLPHSLLMDLRHEAWSPVISRMEFFGDLHKTRRTTERDICHHAALEVPVFAGDTVFTTGDACSRMLFVVKGELTYGNGVSMNKSQSEIDSDLRRKKTLDEFVSQSQDGLGQPSQPSFLAVPQGLEARTSLTNIEVTTVEPGHWLSEAVLWTLWENAGKLSSTSDATLLGVLVEPFMKVMRSHENSMIEASIYAKAFVEILNDTDVHYLTDVSKEKPLAEEGGFEWGCPEANFEEKRSLREMCAVQPVLAWELQSG